MFSNLMVYTQLNHLIRRNAGTRNLHNIKTKELTGYIHYCHRITLSSLRDAAE
jgi:hypothetical protein